MIKEEFISGESSIHKLSPMVRILGACVLSTAIAVCDDLSIATAYLIISFGLVAIAQLNVLNVIQRLKPLILFLLMIWIMVPLTFDGDIIFKYHFIEITEPGVLLCSKISLKSIGILLTFTALIATMSIASLGAGLHQVKVPDKMVFLILMSYRYISVIEEEYKRLLRAAKFRGFKPGTNLHSYQTYAYLVGMLFVRASFRAQRVYQAMLCRGFKHKFHSLDVYPKNRLNFLFLLTILVLSILLILLERIWMSQ